MTFSIKNFFGKGEPLLCIWVYMVAFVKKVNKNKYNLFQGIEIIA